MRSRRRWGMRAMATGVTYLIILLFVFPALWMAVTGFKTESQAYTMPPLIWFRPTLAEFRLALTSGFGTYLAHSVEASLVSTAIAVVLGVPTAYAMVFRMRAKQSNNLLFFVLSTRFMPFAAIIVPLYVIFSKLHLLDTIPALILVYTAMNLPLIIWMGRSYFIDVPTETLEAARIDGASLWQEMFRVAVPLSRSGLTASALLAIIFAWNDFFFAVNLTYTHSPTLPIMVSSFMSNENVFLAKVSGLGTLIVAVPVALGLYAQRHLVRGLSAGALK